MRQKYSEWNWGFAQFHSNKLLGPTPSIYETESTYRFSLFEHDGATKKSKRRVLCPHPCSEHGPCITVVSQGTGPSDKIASCTHCTAMETCRTVDGGNPACHAARTGGSPLKNSRGN